MKGLVEINEFINENKLKVNNQYRLKYHMMPPVGWMNDPNGLVYLDNEFHLFYQFNPYESLPGTMLWGHFKTNDLIKYSDCDVALIPHLEHTSIFSGGAINENNKLNAVYTVHYEANGIKTEQIYWSESNDKIHFEGEKCIFDNERLPQNICRNDFRDPFPIKIEDNYYVFVGGKDIELNKGVIIVLKGKTLNELEYFFTIGPFYELGDMGECPSYFRVDGNDVLLASGCHVLERDNNFKNENSSVFIVGNIDFENGNMQIDFIKEIDKGDIFYAPQFINSYTEPIMIGWLEMWGKPYPTHEMKHGWSGAFSIPRKLFIKDNDIYQFPVEGLNKYHKELTNDSFNKCLDLSFRINNGGFVEIAGDNGNVLISLDIYLFLDTTKANNMNGCVRRTNNSFNECKVRLLLDVSSIEIFVDGGKEAISSRIYLDGKYNISFNEKVNDFDVKEIGVD